MRGLLTKIRLLEYKISEIDDFMIKKFLLEVTQEMGFKYKKNIHRIKRFFNKIPAEKLLYLESRLNNLERKSIGNLLLFEDGYPKSLIHNDVAPHSLTYKGRLELLDSPMLSIVGTRKNSAYGASFAKKVVEYAADMGLTTVSGLANGIDTVVHEHSIKIGVPTVAVLPRPIDRITPQSNTKLAEGIVNAGGLLLSEKIFDQPYSKYVFHMRNRIIAGLSEATVLVESSVSGGGLITASQASRAGRHVYAATADIHRSSFYGNFNLITKGSAIPLCNDLSVISGSYTERDDLKFKVLEEQMKTSIAENLNFAERTIYYAISDGATTASDLLDEHTEFTIPEIAKAIEKLIDKGIINRDKFGRFCIIRQLM